MSLDDLPPTRSEPGGRWEPLTDQLRALRTTAGEPSFSEICRRISEQRRRDGASEHSARIARSTVHDTFRSGRSRINAPLLREIAVALGGRAGDVDDWIALCQARLDPAPAATETVPDPRPATPATAATARRAGAVQVALLMLGCLAVNLVGRQFVDALLLPLYLDMVGTAIAAVALGPWRAAAVGAATNVVGVIGSGWISLPFMLVNITGALVWGYGVHRFGWGRSLPRFLALTLAAALACSAVAVPLLAALVPLDDLREGTDAITRNVLTRVEAPYTALGLSNVLTSVADKLVSGFLALVAVSVLPSAMRGGITFLRAGDQPGS